MYSQIDCSQIESLVDQLSNLEAENEALREQQEEGKKLQITHSRALSDRDDQLRSVQEQLASARRERDVKARQVSSLMVKEAEVNAALRDAQRDLQQCYRKLESMERENRETCAAMDAHQCQNLSLQEEIKRQNQDADAMAEQLESLKAALAEVNKSLSPRFPSQPVSSSAENMDDDSEALLAAMMDVQLQLEERISQVRLRTFANVYTVPR